MTNNYIKDRFTFQYDFVDFFYNYCEAKGIHDPEETLTDEEYSAIEDELKRKLNSNKAFLSKVCDKMYEELDFQLMEAMKELLRR